ncbi:MAG: ABC transporter permease [Thermoanaerobaculia bacterium]|nr:ABC transporter permease [Thermoanaerobaculia bacterium]
MSPRGSSRGGGRRGAAGVVLRKELTDGLRDRRSMMSAFLFPILMPVLFAVMISALARMQDTDKPLELPVVGRERAPNLIAYLEQEGAILQEPPANPEQAVRDGEVPLVLIIPEDYAEDFASGAAAQVRLVLDSSRNDSSAPIRQARVLLLSYSRSIASLRLLARGVSPEIRDALDIAEIDLATPQKLAARLVNFLPMLLMMAAFVAGFNLATDVTAGERERRSLESLLLNPASTVAIVAGKWGAAMLLSLSGVVVTLVASVVAFNRIPLEVLQIRLDLGPREALLLLLVSLPMVPLAAGAQMLVATFARSFKEAQTYVNLLIFVPMLPAILLQVYPLKPALWMMLVPTLSQQILLLDVMKGEALDPLWLALAFVVTLGAGLATALVTARLLRMERIVFGR